MTIFPLCTRDQVKAYLGLTGAAYDAVIDSLIPAATQTLERACRRDFTLTTRTEYHDGGHDRIVLRRRPVPEVLGLWDDPGREFANDTAIEAQDYSLEPELGLVLLRNGRFAKGSSSVKVVYTAGYGVPPGDVVQACIALVAGCFHRGREGADGIDERRVAELSQRFSAEPLPSAVRDLIAAYREPAL